MVPRHACRSNSGGRSVFSYIMAIKIEGNGHFYVLNERIDQYGLHETRRRYPTSQFSMNRSNVRLYSENGEPIDKAKRVVFALFEPESENVINDSQIPTEDLIGSSWKVHRIAPFQTQMRRS